MDLILLSIPTYNQAAVNVFVTYFKKSLHILFSKKQTNRISIHFTVFMGGNTNTKLQVIFTNEIRKNLLKNNRSTTPPPPYILDQEMNESLPPENAVSPDSCLHNPETHFPHPFRSFAETWLELTEPSAER